MLRIKSERWKEFETTGHKELGFEQYENIYCRNPRGSGRIIVVGRDNRTFEVLNDWDYMYSLIVSGWVSMEVDGLDE